MRWLSISAVVSFDDLGDAQAGGIDRDEDGAHSEIGDGLQKPHDLVAREHGGQRVLFARQRDLLGEHPSARASCRRGTARRT